MGICQRPTRLQGWADVGTASTAENQAQGAPKLSQLQRQNETFQTHTHTHKKFLKLPQLNSPDVISFVAIRLCLLFHILIKTTQTKIICLLKMLFFFSLKSAFPSPSSAAWCYLNSLWHHQAAVPVHPAQPLHHSPHPAQAVGAQLQSLRKQDGYF